MRCNNFLFILVVIAIFVSAGMSGSVDAEVSESGDSAKSARNEECPPIWAIGNKFGSIVVAI